VREGIAVKTVWPGLAIHTDSPMSAARTAEVTSSTNDPVCASKFPSLWRGRFEPIRLIHVGWEARKARVDAVVFFLDFPFCRT
jgi:hypothetical protein